MTKLSAGILLHRGSPPALELLLVHPGGPFWAKKDLGAWSIPKGEYATGEDPLTVARREFEEELGSPPPQGDFVDLGELKQPSRKIITVFALRGDFDPATLQSNRFDLEWPPRSGRLQSFPEVDRAQWFALAEARRKIQPGQEPFIDRLLGQLAGRPH
jgi:predicted NUDIX family NTP pyrophosphohydrolase